MDILQKAAAILSQYPLCDSCLGRMFAQLGYGLENKDRGFAVKTLLHMDLVSRYRRGEIDLSQLQDLAKCHEPTRRFLATVGIKVESEPCYICKGLLKDVEKHAAEAVKLLTDIEFNTFAVGTSIPRDILEREAEVVKRFLVDTSESVKHEINRRVGREMLRQLRGRSVDKSRPNIVIKLDLSSGKFEVVRNPVLINGRYIKLSRRLSQMKIFGDIKKTLYQKLSYIAEIFGGEEHVIHAAGREDSDVRMLGPGRPIVVEVKRPKRYNADVPPLADSDVIFTPLGLTDRGEVKRIKEKSKVDIKFYRALVMSEKPLTQEELSKLSELSGKTIIQLTPTRIKRLRRGKKRRRMVYEIVWRQITPYLFEIYVRCQGGLYVKEFIHGDRGRTTPSVAEILNASLEVLELDVLSIE